MVEEFFGLDFGDGGVHVSARVEVFRVEAADCPCDASGGIVHVASCLHRLPAVGAEPVVCEPPRPYGRGFRAFRRDDCFRHGYMTSYEVMPRFRGLLHARCRSSVGRLAWPGDI